MHALVALDALARCGSVSDAAELLGVSPSAVSHRLAALETSVGFELFRRRGRWLTLTARGKRYAQRIHESLAILAEAQDGEAENLRGLLRVSSTPGFAGMWLCNYIADFHKEFPNLQLEVTTVSRLDDVSSSEADVFIAFGDGHWPDYHVQLLYEVDFMPMCSPALLNIRDGLMTAGRVIQHTLLHLQARDDWPRWLTANRLTVAANHSGITFSDMMLVQAAAVAGQGVMMGDRVTCSTSLAAGQLIIPLDAVISPRGGYYLVTDRGTHPNPAASAFIRWLQALIARVGVIPEASRQNRRSRD